MYKILVRPLLFCFDPERVHYWSLGVLNTFFKIPLTKKIIQKIYSIENPKLERKLFGITFKNPVGLAAGFDKNGKYIKNLSTLGFGFIEIGTITPKPQSGNPKKRLFRLKEDTAIINRMGFNNDGVLKIKNRLKKNHKVIIGGNIGKNK